MGDPLAIVYHDLRNIACACLTVSVRCVSMMTADQIIDGCGGTSALATTLALTPSTVSSWREVNFIPRWWHGPVLKAAKRAKFTMDDMDFPPRSARRSRAA